jgi:hypothetical protein
LYSCRQEANAPAYQPEALRNVDLKFTLLDPSQTGVQFINQMQEDYHYNNFSFEYMYNGGGVAVGDVNDDGLPDLYFSSSGFPISSFSIKAISSLWMSPI